MEQRFRHAAIAGQTQPQIGPAMDFGGRALRRWPVTVGFVSMFLFTWPVEFWRVAASRGWVDTGPPEVLAILVGWGFVLAAVLLTASLDGRPGLRALGRRLLSWRVGLHWYLVALGGFVVIDLLALALTAGIRGTPPDFSAVYARNLFGPDAVLWVFVLPFFVVEAVANGEEFGWRGYSLPRLLRRHSALGASVLLGAVWAVWHLPKFWVVGGTHEGVGWFLLDVLAKAVLFTWLYQHTRGSLLLAILFHASINVSAVFLPVMSAVTGDPLPYAIAVVLKVLWAGTVVWLCGPEHLARNVWATRRQ